MRMHTNAGRLNLFKAMLKVQVRVRVRVMMRVRVMKAMVVVIEGRICG
jgi:hypothetical protein